MDLAINKVFICRHVRFNEHVFPFAAKTVVQPVVRAQPQPWGVANLSSSAPSAMVVPSRMSQPVVATRGCRTTVSHPVPREHGSMTHSRARTEGAVLVALSAETWRLVPFRAGMNVVGCKWVFRNKRKADGLAFFDTFSPVVKPTTVSLLLSLALTSAWVVRELDVHNAFLNGALAKTVYMSQPPGGPCMVLSRFRVPGLCVCMLSCCLWGFGRPKRESLSIEIVATDDGMLLSQKRYMFDFLKRAGKSDCKPLTTHIPMSRASGDSSKPYADPTRYRSLAGALQYLTMTRPDLSFAAGCPVDRKSMSRFAMFLDSNLVSWVCKKQHTVAQSSTKAEYKAIADMCAEVTWVVTLLRELGVPLVFATYN
ncbi:uncharacterized protein LOC116029633 [Ipomoea triloba]|uniref:uncharacterized protein LOC116029633 n=1 Tax=Ipomoea triloba TaxID=35885 RepID=UPI00125D4C6C|nr:uncharacterized protein LOC116029633 [Ipomoea triloba]